MSKEKIELNNILKDITKMSVDKLNQQQDLSKNNENTKLSAKEIRETLKSMNPILAQFLVIETLESNFIKRKYGAYPNSTAHQIKELIENKYNDFNGIENKVDRLESLAINLIHEKTRKSIQFEEGLDQDIFIKNNLQGRLRSFHLLPDRLHEGIQINQKRNLNQKKPT